jgi:hypothetical protein
MPSDPRTRLVLDALKAETSRFLTALAASADDVRSQIDASASASDGRAARLASELGPFAAGRIDAERLARLTGGAPTPDPAATRVLQQTLGTFETLIARGESLLVVTVTEASGLRDAVASALAELGRCFTAARAALDVRSGRRAFSVNGDAPGVLPFAQWTKSERQVAPPLVVRLLGSDVRAAGLAEFLDGRQKIVLVIEGECPPAPLARLITPRTFAVQTTDATGLERFAQWDGPGIAALVPESAARFVHNPAAGNAAWERLAVAHVPSDAPRRTMGGLSPAQQIEDVELLRTLATRPPAGAPAGSAPADPGPDADPAERLAAWLLRQADLRDLG